MEVLARFCPTEVSVEGVPDLASVTALSPRHGRVLEHLVARLLVLVLELQLELALRFPTRVRAVAQACSGSFDRTVEVQARRTVRRRSTTW